MKREDLPLKRAPAGPLLASVGAAVRGLRQERELTRRELAAKSGVSERFLAELESGQGNISVSRLQDVASALDITAGELLFLAEAGLGAAEAREAQQWLRARFQTSAAPLVALVGLRGAGKSTIGRALAGRLRVPFVELDAQVEKDAGLSLSAIFSLHGEAYYRRLAREVLTRLLGNSSGGGVIATGGSLVTDREAWSLLRSRCRTVWLSATPEDHWQRVLKQGDVRPSAASPHAKEELRALLEARVPLYSQAELSVDTSRLGIEGAVSAIAAGL